MKIGYFILGVLMFVGLLVYFFASPIILLGDYTLRDAGFGLFGLSFFLSFMTALGRLSRKKQD